MGVKIHILSLHRCSWSKGTAT